MAVFDNYSKYYDLLYQDKDYKKESDFIINIMKSNMPEAKTVLDLGCGSGRHAALIAEHGYNIHGVDRSDSILEEAEKRKDELKPEIRKRLSYSQGDVRTFTSEKKYDVVTSLFHVMSYMPENNDLQAAFSTAATHVKSGGIFIFDSWYGPAVLSDKPSPRIKKIENEHIQITRIAEPEIFPNKNLVDVNYYVLVKDKKTNQIEQINETHRMRYWFMTEIEYFLGQSGFELIKSGEWMTDKQPGFESWYVYYVGRKK